MKYYIMARIEKRGGNKKHQGKAEISLQLVYRSLASDCRSNIPSSLY